MVLAFPEDQEAIRRYIEGAKDQSIFEAIPLANLEAKKVYDNLTNLFDVKNGPAPTLDFDASRNVILVRGTPEQIAAVKQVLKQLGENAHAGTKTAQTGVRSTPSVIPTDKRNRLKLLEDKLEKLHTDFESLRQELRLELKRDRPAP